MTQLVFTLIQYAGFFFLIYLILYASYVLLAVVMGAFQLYKRDRMVQVRNELIHSYYMPVSILVPAHNEDVTIVDNIKSLLNLDYRLYEVIIIDDGSTDNTADVLIKRFKMRKVNRPIRLKLPCQPYKEIYETNERGVAIMLIKKINGGKGDALNMGINASQYPYFLCIDADSMLQRDSLEKIVQPVLEDDSIVAVGGMIRVAQCAKIEKGMLTSHSLPKNFVVCMQVVEYDRSFLASRILMDQFNGNLIISGAFGLFKKDIVTAVGGYNTGTLGEDMELIVRLHVYCRNNLVKYSIRYEPNAVCWSQAPTTLRDLSKQRRRWHLGLFQSMASYRQIFANPRFGSVSWISYMYYLLFELFSPVIEVFGILTMILAFIFGLLNLPFMLRYILLYITYGSILTITAFFQQIYIQRLRVTASDMARALSICLIENGFFRYFLSFVRVTAFIGYRKRKNQWGSIKRVTHH